MHFQFSFESFKGGRSSQVGRQRVPDNWSDVTKRTSTEGFQIGLWNFGYSVEERRERVCFFLLYALVFYVYCRVLPDVLSLMFFHVPPLGFLK